MPLDALNGQPTKNQMSRINSYKRDWSSSQDSEPAPSSSQGSSWAPAPPSSLPDQDAKAAARARRLKKIQDALDAPEEPPAVTGKRNAPIDVDSLDNDGPSAPKRHAPAWGQLPNIKPSERNFLAKEQPFSLSAPAPAPVPAKPVVIKLSSEQRHILNLVAEGKNIFFTGSAGAHARSSCTPTKRV